MKTLPVPPLNLIGKPQRTKTPEDELESHPRAISLRTLRVENAIWDGLVAEAGKLTHQTGERISTNTLIRAVLIQHLKLDLDALPALPELPSAPTPEPARPKRIK